MANLEYYEKAADVSDHLYFKKQTFLEDSDYYMMPHFHDSLELIFVKEGEYQVKVGQTKRLLKAGEMAFVDSFTPHSYLAANKAKVYAVVIDKKLLDEDLFFKRVFPPFPRISEEGFSDIVKFFDATEGNIYSNKQTKIGFSNMLIGLLLKYCETVEKKEDKAVRTFTEVLKYLNTHFKEDLSLKNLAAKFSYAESYFSALFNDFVGMSLREYLNRKRIAEVLRIKSKHPDKSLFSIAETCGYTNEKTFYRAYAKYKR